MLKYLFFCLALTSHASWAQEKAEDSATESSSRSESFTGWLWDEQFKPTIKASWDTTGQIIFLGGLAGAAVVHQYDNQIYEKTRDNPNTLMDRSYTDDLAFIGSGVLGISIALGQVYFDEPNGLMHSRALIMTTLSHLTLALLVQRERPGGREDYLPFKSSFPSGHASSAFATAASLGYAYGWKVGLPAYALASAISLSRVEEGAHWSSDIVMGAALGIFWARASFQAESKNPSKLYWSVLPTADGTFISVTKRF